MSKILISGYYGFSNAGDEAMLTAIIKALRDKAGDVEITVLSGKPEITATKHEVASVHRFNCFGVLLAMLSTDLLLSGGGSLLQDVTSKRSLLYYLSILLLAKLLGKRTMLYAQGIGPINSPLARRVTSWVCKKSDLITVRDDGSYEELKEMGISSEKIIVTADAVFSLKTETKDAGSRILSAKGLTPEQPLIGIALRNWTGEERFRSVFAAAAIRLSSAYNANIVFLPMQFPEDTCIAEEVAAQIAGQSQAVVLKEGYSTEEYLSIIANLDLLIGMRLHALVFAALEGVPFLAVSYDPKVDRFVKGMEGLTAGSIAGITGDDIVDCAEKLWQQIPEKQNRKINELRKEARLNAERAVGLTAE